MNKVKKIFVLLLSVVVVSFGLIGCKGEGKPPAGDTEASKDVDTKKADNEHPAGEHPTGEHPE